MKSFLAGAALFLLSLGGLVSCATTETDPATKSANSSVPGAGDPDRAGSLSPAAGANGAGANVKF